MTREGERSGLQGHREGCFAEDGQADLIQSSHLTRDLTYYVGVSTR